MTDSTAGLGIFKQPAKPPAEQPESGHWTKFLRKEARQMYLSLPFQIRRTTSEKEIYRRMKRQWKKGDKLSKEAQVKAMNYKDYKQKNA